jgi:hypothetical protein
MSSTELDPLHSTTEVISSSISGLKYLTTDDGQSILISGHHLEPAINFLFLHGNYLQTFGVLMRGAISDERTDV